MTDISILLTNDDGIDAPGLRALFDGLGDLGDTVAVAPTVNHSGLGRVLSYGRPVPLATGETTAEMAIDPDDFTYDLPFRRHELGYELEGTPCDCVVAGLRAFELDPDLVVSGCNAGPNVGTSAFGRSGTVSAAMEAAYLGVPGVAISAARPDDDTYDFGAPVEFTRHLLEFLLNSTVFESVDYLNVVVPPDPTGVEITRPADDYEMDATANGDQVRIHHTTMKRSFYPDGAAGPGTDRYAILNDRVSVTPMTLPHSHEAADGLRTFAESWAP